MQQRLVARAADIGKHWPELPVARKRTVLTALIERIEVSVDQIDIRLRPPRLNVLIDVTATPLQSMTDDEIQTLSVPVRLRRAGREIRMVIDGADPFAAAKPDARLIKLLLRARRFNATLAESESVPFAALAQREGVSRSYFTRLVLGEDANDFGAALDLAIEAFQWICTVDLRSVVFGKAHESKHIGFGLVH